MHSAETITTANTHEIESLINRAFEARINNISLSILLAEDALCKSQIQGHKRLEARAHNMLGLLNMIRGAFQESLDYSKKALEFFEDANDLKGIAEAKYNIGSVYYKTDNYLPGLRNLLDCLSLFQKLNDFGNVARVFKALGTIYEFFGDVENAIACYEKCIEAAEKVDDIKQVANAYNPLSGIYLKQARSEEALDIAEKSISIKEQTNDVRGLAFALYARGKVLMKREKYFEAFNDFSKCLSIHLQFGERLGAAMAYNKMGLLFLNQNKYKEAEENFKEALKVGEQYNIQLFKFKSYYNLYLSARNQSDETSALKYLELYIKKKEEVINGHTYNVVKGYELLQKIDKLESDARSQQEKTEIIERKNDEIDSFFYRVSHDLKGPISSLLGLINVSKYEMKNDKSMQYIDLFQSQVNRINTIVMDLINLTRMKHLEEAKVNIDFEKLTEECIQSCQYLENFSSIKFIMDIDSIDNFKAEPAIVNTILQNLIENAIKYARTNTNSFVRVCVKQLEDHLSIQVEDNGLGIHPDYQPKIFNMFYRANTKADGSGLGLYILNRAVERLNGKVDFTSEINKGTTFEVRLPLHDFKT